MSTTRFLALGITLAIFLAPLACASDAPESLVDAKTAVELRLATRDESMECLNCREFVYEGVLGEMEKIRASAEPAVVLSPAMIRGVTAWQATDGFHIALIGHEGALWRLSALAESASKHEVILVSVGQYQLGIFTPSLLKASRGTLGFAFTEEHYFQNVLRTIGGDEIFLAESSDEELLESCTRIADPVARGRCRRNTWAEIQHEKQSLQRAEELLKSDSEEDREAAVDELLKD